MKRFLVCIYALFATIGIFATGQAGDLIFIDGEMWVLLGKPLYADSLLHSNLIDILPKERSVTTANWDGYTGYWSIDNDRLILDSIRVPFWNVNTRKYRQESIPPSDMRHIFNSYYDKDDIIATWLTDTIRIGKGEQMFYMHDGYLRNHEYEQFIAINRGIVTERKSYHNKVVVDGFSFSMLKSQEEIREKFPLDLKSYPELDEVKRIIFSIRDVRLDSLGNLVDCHVSAFIPRQDRDNMQFLEGLENSFKMMLKSISPWKTLYINGEYVSENRFGYTIPYIVSK
jgi:hypothetical protein